MTVAPDHLPLGEHYLRPLRTNDLVRALQSGWNDFRSAPAFGLFFSAIYVIIGIVLVRLGAGLFTWTLTVLLAFPLVAPFLAVGLYEVSRRLETAQPLDWRAVLGVVWRERTRQIPWAGAIILVYVLFWSFLAHMIFALFMGPSMLLGPPDNLSAYTSGAGLWMVLAEIAVGAVFAFLLFALTAISLPLLLDREVDFVTAMLLSLKVTRQNLLVMLIWAALIAALSLAALAPMFLGLFVVLPILGHASWHLYRRAVTHRD